MSSSPVSPLPDERRRILVLIKGLGLGGAETLVAESSRYWDRSEFEYGVAYLLPWKSQLVRRLEDRDVAVTCIDWTGPADIGGLRRLRAHLSAFRPDLIHSHLPVAGVLGRAMKGNARHVYSEHNVVDFYRQPTRTINRVTYGLNDAVIAVSNAVASSIDGYSGPRPRVIPNGVVVPEVGPEDIRMARDELGISGQAPLVVHIGNIRPHKGHENLTQAASLLARERPDVVVVSIGGEKHEGDLERVRRRAAELGVADSLLFLGRRPDALKFLAAADVAVNPSDVEGLPLFVLEALALGKPVVATDVGGVASLVHPRKTGLLVRPGDPGELARAISEALASPAGADWGAAGKALVANHHGLASMVAGHEQIYRELLA